MTSGSNLPLPAPRVRVEVTAPRALDVSGLLVTAGGKVRSDDDFVFYNQPNGPGVSHRPASPASPDSITVDTASVPADIDKVVITASLDGGARFAGTEPTATVRDADSGGVLATFTPPALSTETALIVVEVYRRGTGWKVRAVGQGYANGLAGIATDFGVSVDDAPQPPPAQPAAAMPPPSAAPAQAPAAPMPPAPSPPAPPAAPAPPAGPAPGGMINLDKGRVSLTKYQSVSLVKTGRPPLTVVRMGLGWEPASRGKSIDLDASVIAFDPQRKKLATCWFMKTTVLGGAIAHSGDNLTGQGAGDDEVITVDLSRLPAEVSGLVFVVNSFTGQKFTAVAKAYCRLLDGSAGEAELVRFDLTSSEPRTGLVLCKLIRQFSGEWHMTAIGDYVDAKTVRGMVKPAAALL